MFLKINYLFLPLCQCLLVCLCQSVRWRLSPPICALAFVSVNLCIGVCLCQSVRWLLSLPICALAFVSAYLCVGVCLCLPVCWHLSLPVCMSAFAFVLVFVTACLYVGFCLCLCVGICLCLSMCWCLSLSLCVSAFACVLAFFSAYLCVSVCYWLSACCPFPFSACRFLNLSACWCLSLPICHHLSLLVCVSAFAHVLAFVSAFLHVCLCLCGGICLCISFFYQSLFWMEDYYLYIVCLMDLWVPSMVYNAFFLLQMFQYPKKLLSEDSAFVQIYLTICACLLSSTGEFKSLLLVTKILNNIVWFILVIVYQTKLSEYLYMLIWRKVVKSFHKLNTVMSDSHWVPHTYGFIPN